MKPIVFIASPYTKGDPAINVHFQCQVFEEIMNAGLAWPVAPLWTHFQHTVFPRPYESWLEYDQALLQRYDACLRLTAVNLATGYEQHESSGADKEVKSFIIMGKPVFYTIPAMHEWAKEWNK